MEHLVALGAFCDMSALVHAGHVSSKQGDVSEGFIAVGFGARNRSGRVGRIPVVIDVVKNGTFVIAIFAFVDFGPFRLDDAVFFVSMMSIGLSLVRAIVV